MVKTLTEKLAKQAAWKATPVALVQRPLRFIRNHTASEAIVNGKKETVYSEDFYLARYMASIGAGSVVRTMARNIAIGVGT